MKYASYAILGTAAIGSLNYAAAKNNKPLSQPDKQPNIILFLADDLGWSDVGCYGSPFYETPNIDRLAKEGVRFTHAYSACHVSSPSRASIMTGCYPASMNLTDWLPGRGNHKFQKLLNNVTEQQLPENRPTIAEQLRETGYKTAIIGKWHIGTGAYGPLSRGFDMHTPSQWQVGWPRRYHYPFQMNGFDGEPGEYLTDRMTDEAIGYIAENSDQPFFLFLSHFAVHDPVEGRADLVEKYTQKRATMPKPSGEPYILEGNPDDPNPLSRRELDSLLHTAPYSGFSVLPNRTVKIKQHQDNVEFAAMVESMDESLGRIVTKLHELGIEDNTIIIFASDNGGMSAANFNNPRHIVAPEKLDKEYPTSNLPLRGGKGWMYEGGIRIPMIIKYPRSAAKGLICDVPVITNDFFATIMEMAGATTPSIKTQGVNLLPLFKGRKIEDRALYWYFPHYSNHGMQSPGGAIRWKNYKLLEYYENNTVQLFDLDTDPGEQHEISAIHPHIVNKLRKKLHHWRDNIGAVGMRENPTYQH